ncbi:uncharacterized protein LOC115327900 [Ixodes scapularis]|uniref:uncharacterized protein LOC115327900 n=1 Tax=Ixodes scapularis TaxID=6945 RepID=UPI001A9E77AD|nr:uncharacterized protein LOC115327900 [Ixodes scapularis]
MSKRQTQCRHCFVPGCTTGYVSVRKNERKASLFAVPDDDERRQVWQRSIPQADKPLAKNSVVCEAHFDERFIVRNYTHVINRETVEIPRGRPYLTADAIPTLFPNVLGYLSKKLPSKGGSTTSNSGVPRERKRNLNQEDDHTVSTPPVTQCDSHETLESMGEEPEDILPTSADEGVHSDDYGKMSPFPLKLDGHEAVVIKEEPEDAPPTLTDQSVQSDHSGNMSMYPLHLEGHEDNAVSVKIEPGLSAFLQTDEGLCSGASDSASSVQVHLGEPWKDGHLLGIEVPYEKLAMPARADFRSEDSDRVLPSRLDLEGHWNNSCAVKEEADEASATSTCGDLDGKDARRLSVSLEPVDVVHRATVVVKEEPADVEWQSSDSEESSSSLSSQEPSQLMWNARAQTPRKAAARSLPRRDGTRDSRRDKMGTGAMTAPSAPFLVAPRGNSPCTKKRTQTGTKDATNAPLALKYFSGGTACLLTKSLMHMKSPTNATLVAKDFRRKAPLVVTKMYTSTLNPLSVPHVHGRLSRNIP